MSRMYTCEFENQAVTAQVDVFEFIPATNRPIELVGLFIGQHTEVVSNVGRDEYMRIRIIRGYTTTGSTGGTSPTPAPVEEFDASAGFTCKILNTVLATGGSPINLHSEPFNVRTGYGMVWPAESGLQCSATQNRLVVRFMSAPSESISFTATAYIREI